MLVSDNIENDVYFMLFGAALALKQINDLSSDSIQNQVTRIALRIGNVPVNIISQALRDADDVLRVDHILPKWEHND